MIRVWLIKTGMLVATLVWAGYSHAIEFKDYDFSQFSQEVTDCDRLTSHGRDPGHVYEPTVTSKTMDKPAAIKACHEAVAADPENPRLNYQLARAYGYSNRGEEAMPYRMKAVEQNYPQSLFVIGYLYSIGRTIDKDICKAMGLWIRGAQYRRLAALVALPRAYMRGDFKSCGTTISDKDLQAYLEEAQSLTSDFYTEMLIEDLLAEVSRR